MPPSQTLPPIARIAIVADPHFHDLYGDYGIEGVSGDDGRRMSVRLLSDTVKSTRVFNESYAAFRQALEDIAASGIRDVILLGDYSDDGQVETVGSVRRLLEDFEKRLDLRFYATVGNHDIFAADGRHRTKRLLAENGRYAVATSDADVRDTAAVEVSVTGAMYCRGYPDGLSEMAAFGFFPRGDELHWETPFGRDSAAESRCYDVVSPDGTVSRRLMDASYLVEPTQGIWLAMIDANVFAPVDGVVPGSQGDFTDSTGAGWNGMLRHKAFIFDWLADVSRRAQAADKRLVVFSHYPVLDPLDGTAADERALLGETGMTKRIPVPAVAERLMAAGVDLHFSGHLHVNDTARVDGAGGRYLVNIAVPALVAFPCAYKVLGVFGDRYEIESREIGHMPIDPDLDRLYGMEVAASGLQVAGLLAARSYGAFLHEHLGHLVGRRHLKREWPRPLADMLRTASLEDIVLLSQIDRSVGLREIAKAVAGPGGQVSDGDVQALALACHHRSMTALDFLRDWYRLRMASELALPWIDPESMDIYQRISGLYGSRLWDERSAQSKIARLFRMFDRYKSGLPSHSFSIDRTSGAIVDRRT